MINGKIERHKTDFEELYKGIIPLTDNELRFPLVDITKNKFRRHPNTHKYSCLMYRRFSCHILSRLSLKNNLNILIIGCGRGSDEKNIKTLFPSTNLWSIDISSFMVQSAIVSKIPSNCSIACAEYLPFPDNCFDRILSREVIEHVMNPQMMLNEINRVLKPGAISVITTENRESVSIHGNLVKKARYFITKSEQDDHSDYKDEAPTRNEFENLVYKSNLKNIETLWDGALHHTLLRYGSFFSSLILYKLGIQVSALENNKILAYLFCDQVKYVLQKPLKKGKSTNDVFFCRPGGGIPLLHKDQFYFCPETEEKFRILNGIPELLPVSMDHSNQIETHESDIFKIKKKNVISKKIMNVISKAYCMNILLIGFLLSLLMKSNKKEISNILYDKDPLRKYLKL